jgi:hypothetical protein
MDAATNGYFLSETGTWLIVGGLRAAMDCRSNQVTCLGTSGTRFALAAATLVRDAEKTDDIGLSELSTTGRAEIVMVNKMLRFGQKCGAKRIAVCCCEVTEKQRFLLRWAGTFC